VLRSRAIDRKIERTRAVKAGRTGMDDVSITRFSNG
jgi:hypothetical protein